MSDIALTLPAPVGGMSFEIRRLSEHGLTISGLPIATDMEAFWTGVHGGGWRRESTGRSLVDGLESWLRFNELLTDRVVR